MIELKRTTSKDPDFNYLNKILDMELTIRDGDEHAFFDQFNKIDTINHIIVAYDNGDAVGCGAIKMFDREKAEIKRMFVLPEARGKMIASRVLKELEEWSKELGYNTCILETGGSFKDAIGLYIKTGYEISKNYGQYLGIKSSVCFSKSL
ncbi:GNAT family N-acetyltransferase [Gillisia sp. CAL575]|uniref:GNAT family N-acetyltransferase n=1 Tax=Gillisia sp. CAL575 TaxID=985255 RepID=UPI0003A6CE3B|nr:GNAT family N-acetyltransferase [Gillisia sp. CAL575]